MLRRALDGERRRAPPARRRAPARCRASRFARRVELAVGQQLARGHHQADGRLAAPRRRLLRSNSSSTVHGSAGADGGGVPRRDELARAPPRRAAAAPRAALGCGDAGREQGARSARPCAPRWPRRRGRCCTRGGRRARRRARRRRASGRTSPSACRLDGAAREPGERRARPRGAFWSTSITWKSGVCARLRSGCSSSTSCSNGTSWWRRRRAPPRDAPASELAERRDRRQVGAQHQRVHEEADQAPRSPTRVAVGDRRADHQVVLPAVAARAAPAKAASSVMNSVAPSRPRQRLAAPPSAPRSSANGVAAAAERLRRAAAAGRSAGRAPPGAPSSCPLPVARAAPPGLAAQPVALPGREVGVLHRQLGQRRRAARRANAA